MRHGDTVNALGRKSAHRKALLSNLAISLIKHKRINTTLAKAKELRKYIEPLLTKSKSDTTHSRRIVFSYLENKEAINELFRDVAPKISNRPGGYTRIIKTGFRKGDGAEMCLIELVDFNSIYNIKGSDTTSKSKRTRRGSKKVTATTSTKETKSAVAKKESVAENDESKNDNSISESAE